VVHDERNLPQSAIGAFPESNEHFLYEQSVEQERAVSVNLPPEVVGHGSWVDKKLPVARVKAERAEKRPRFISIIIYKHTIYH